MVHPFLKKDKKKTFALCVVWNRFPCNYHKGIDTILLLLFSPSMAEEDLQVHFECKVFSK